MAPAGQTIVGIDNYSKVFLGLSRPDNVAAAAAASETSRTKSASEASLPSPTPPPMVEERRIPSALASVFAAIALVGVSVV